MGSMDMRQLGGSDLQVSGLCLGEPPYRLPPSQHTCLFLERRVLAMQAPCFLGRAHRVCRRSSCWGRLWMQASTFSTPPKCTQCRRQPTHRSVACLLHCLTFRRKCCYRLGSDGQSLLYDAPQGRSEAILGTWLRRQRQVPRSSLVLATKVAGPGGMEWLRGGPLRLDAANITAALDASLARLGTDHVDLLQLHWPDRCISACIPLLQARLPAGPSLVAFGTLQCPYKCVVDPLGSAKSCAAHRFATSKHGEGNTACASLHCRYVPMFGDLDFDPTMAYAACSFEEQLEALVRAVTAGKVGGASNRLPADFAFFLYWGELKLLQGLTTLFMCSMVVALSG